MALEAPMAQNQNEPNAVAGTDPWSDKTWGKNGMVAFDSTDQAPSLDGKEEDVFAFQADPHADLESQFLETTSQASGTGFLFSSDNNLFRQTGTETAVETGTSSSGIGRVQVAIHEQVSALYDGVTEEPACHVEGSIYVQPSRDLQATPFLLVIRDLENHVAHWKDWPSTCQNVSEQVPRQHRTDRVLQITTRVPKAKTPTSTRLAAEEALIGQYICTDRVRPVPLLIKSRVVTNSRYCRVGFKVRANPSNALPLTRVVLLLAVPPHMEGRTAKMSRKGGVWDELKRTISWVIPQLEPGQALEIQAQFEGPDDEPILATPPRFPILARGDYGQAFSSLSVKKTDARVSGTQAIQTLQINKSGRILHRKV
uniref:MHD domain-containing protein n=1 Tax=Entomoneis paludosa TaxID=265537 RepID=A0A7S2YCF4_9STRA|mmetsp:Transcript_27227/g.57036  ORF Transcript_27227/g.57036 Transcript_27227/m.57036 type:complete len:369 (+) Transcript_27227:141-1247(+)